MEFISNYIWKRIMRRRRLVLLKSPYKRIFSAGSAFVWITSLVIGFDFLDTTRLLKRLGQCSVYTYFLAALTQIIPLWSYLELTSIISTSGGLYHYAYSVSNELVGFMVGWLQILAATSKLVAIADTLAFQIDASIFNNAVEAASEKYLSVDLSIEAAFYVTNYPQFLRLFVIMTTAAFSTSIEIANIVNSVVFYVVLCSIFCLCILLAADLDLEHFVTPNLKCIATFFAGCYEISNVFTSVYCLVHLGGEVKQAEKNIPRVLVVEFIVVWVTFTLLPQILTLPMNIQNTHRLWILTSILEQTGGYSLLDVIAVIATGLQFSGLFVYFFTLSRIVVAMAQDGLLFPVFSRVESVTKYPVKPNLLLGILGGIVAMTFQKEFLESVGKVTECLLACLVPVCVMLLRYTDAPLFLMKQKKEKVTPIEPFEYAGIAVWTMFGSTVAVSVLICDWTSNYIINQEFPTHKHPYRLGFAGIVFISAATFLIFQKQNVIKTPFRVPFVPFVPVLSIFIHAFLFLVLPANVTMAIGAWAALGIIFYFAYAMKHSRERLLLL